MNEKLFFASRKSSTCKNKSMKEYEMGIKQIEKLEMSIA
jgi:hypothetical protein